MNRSLYVLDEAGRPVLEMDVLAWSEWMAKSDNVLRVDDVGPCRVSSVFETVVFRPEGTLYWGRFGTREETKRAHEAAVLTTTRANQYVLAEYAASTERRA